MKFKTILDLEIEIAAEYTPYKPEGFDGPEQKEEVKILSVSPALTDELMTEIKEMIIDEYSRQIEEDYIKRRDEKGGYIGLTDKD